MCRLITKPTSRERFLPAVMAKGLSIPPDENQRCLSVNIFQLPYSILNCSVNFDKSREENF